MQLKPDCVLYKLPDSVLQEYTAFFGEPPIAEMVSHLKRELMQAIWALLLNCADFLHAYVHGIVILCADGIQCFVFPQFFTYSADYPKQ